MSHSKHYVFGLHSVRQIFTNDVSRVVEIWAQQNRQDEKLLSLLNIVQQQALPVQYVPKKTLDKLTDDGHHQGIVIRCHSKNQHIQLDLEDFLAQLTTTPFLLVLDGVQDPHNLGACLRTADAAGVNAVIIPKHRACGLTPTVEKVASGAADNVPLIQVTNLANALQQLQAQNIWVLGAAEDVEQTIFTTDFNRPIALVLGAEGKGLRHLTKNNCDELVRLPMYGKVESLNVSVATGVCLYEALRQRTVNNLTE